MAQRLLHSKAPQCAEADGNATTASARFNRLGIRIVVVKMPGLDATVFSPPPRERATSYAGRLMIAAALAVILLFSLQVDETKMLLAIGGVGALLVIVYGLPFVTRHRDWLICAFVRDETPLVGLTMTAMPSRAISARAAFNWASGFQPAKEI